MKKIILLFLLIFSVSAYAQNYFQQEVNYTINVELNDKNHTLLAEETIEYTNNSPNDLDFLWFHIWPNAYKNNSTMLVKHEMESGNTDLFYATEEERGWIENLNFTVDGKAVKWEYHPQHIDICKIILNSPIKSGESITITTPFLVKIPHARFSRLGHVDESYMITQWYPKPAVYDKDGWHEMPYLSQGEFYSEFGSFDVSITLPQNYTVGATGDLQNKGELIRLEELAKITDTITQFEKSMSFPDSDKKTKTIRYVQEKVHDFGWFADKRYHVLKGEVQLPYSGRIVTLYTMFTNNEADLWKNSIEYMHDAVYYYSLWNGDYPYNYCTAVDGTIAAGGGMEYPNVTVIGESSSAKGLEEVIMHEVGHNWFYGILGSNERDHAWMDEGINSYNEYRYMKTKYPNYSILDKVKFRKLFDLEKVSTKNIMGELVYFMGAWTATDQPIDLPSSDYTGMNYGGIVYSKTAICFEYLAAYLGQEVFDDCMQSYFQQWKFKHPQPSDLKAVFESKTQKDLSWFFDDIIKTTKQLDYAITSAINGENNLLITLKNKGEIAGPVVVCGVKNAVAENEVWIDGFLGEKTIAFPKKQYDHIRIDFKGDMPETNRNNNIYKFNGIFKKSEPIKLQLIGSWDHADKTQIFFHPMMNYNIYNKHSYGISIYNQFLPKEGLFYKATPLYNIDKKSVVGNMNLAYTKHLKNGFFSSYKLRLDAEKYDYTFDKEYRRYAPELELVLREPSLRSKKLTNINLKLIKIEKEVSNDNYFTSSINHSDNRALNPYSVYAKFEKGTDYNKVEIIADYTYKLNQKKNLKFRAFLGYTNSTTNPLQMSAWNGSMDYSLSYDAISRETSNNHDLPYTQQMFMNEGGLVHFTGITSSNYLATLKTEYNLTNKIKLYAEGGTSGTEIAYGTGLHIPIFQNLFGLYLPIYTEDGMVKLDETYKDIFRFELNLNMKFNLFF